MVLNNDSKPKTPDEESLNLPDPAESTLVDFSLNVEIINNDVSEVDCDDNSDDD